VLQQSASNPPIGVQQGLDLHHAYVRLLCCTLAGYALLGKSFAYVGIAPLFVGEIALGLGLCVVLRSGCRLALLATVPSLLVATLFTLVMTAALACVFEYGIDAIRDSVILLYSLFAFIVIALILEEPGRLRWILSTYGRFAWLYGMIGGVVFNLTAFLATHFYESELYLPGTNIVMPFIRAGEAASHLSAVAVFMLLGLRRVSLPWALLLFANIVLVVPANRGALLSCVVPLGLAAALGGQMRRLIPVLLVGSVLLATTYVVGLKITLKPESDGRSIGAAQIFDNFASILGTSDAGNLDATKTWRLTWWTSIGNYTLNGPYFWTGKGYGMSLGEEDGFTEVIKGQPILRSPHSVHMNVLARSGVPGLVLWVSALAAWFMMLMNAHFVARRRGETQWANLFLWVACYGLAMLIDASFDVALEGPMIGIWFWSLVGVGIASTMVYRAYLDSTGAAPPLLPRSSSEPHRSAQRSPNGGP
jgi:hypothetical protein